MNKKMTILLTILCLVLASGLMVINVSGQELTYADGYEDGKVAAKEDVEGDPNPYFSYTGSVKYQTLPEHRIEQIKNKPSAYQKGFREGYKDGAEEALASSPNFWSGYLLAMLGFSVVFAFLISRS